MSEELEQLQKLGAQKIYEQTHIPVQNVQALLHSSFDSFSRVQFLGFVSILEREYNTDLSSLKEEGLSYFNDKTVDIEAEGIFISSKKNRKPSIMYVGIVAIIILIAIVISYSTSDNKELEEEILDDTLIQNVQKNIQPKIEEIILTPEVDLNTTETIEENIALEVVEPVVIETKSFEIVTKSKVWFGYIDVATNKKYQKTFKGTEELDPTKTWLLMFGHGYINMFINGEVVKFDSRNYVRFLYEDGKLKHISKKEFKRLNRGRSW